MSSNQPERNLMTYEIGRGETGVFQFEPYKSASLPHWRFRTVPIAKESSCILYQQFLAYYDERDFVGMDMARKFIQMGMTRAKRYANYKGGKKFVNSKGTRTKVEKSRGHHDREEKEMASLVFGEVWEKCKGHEGYQELKTIFLREQKEWKKTERQEPKRFRVKTNEKIKMEHDLKTQMDSKR